MKILVCVKQVPDTETKIKIGADNSSIDTTGIKWVVNPYDEYAIEEAIKTRDANPGSQIHVISVGPKKRTVEAVRTALAMGADEGILVDAPENLDPLTTSKILSSAIKAEGGYDVVYTGKLAIDDNASSVPQMTAQLLNASVATVISKVSIQGSSATVERDVEGGAKEIIQLSGSMFIAANKGLNMPRYASLPGIMKAKKKTLKEIDYQTLNVENNPTSKITSMELPAEKSSVKMLAGDSSAQVADLVKLLRDEAKVL